MTAMIKQAKAALEIGFAVALTLGGIGAGYVAGHISADHHAQAALTGAIAAPHPAEDEMERLLLILLGREVLR